MSGTTIGAPDQERAALHLIAAGAPLEAAARPETMGFKAYNLARMAALRLNVPPAFVLGTGYCAMPAAVTPDLWRGALARLEGATGLRFGDPRRPLLLSVRSGAPVSMPGMMETLLNIGLTEETLPGLIRLTGHPRLAWDAYRRLIAGYGEVVAGIAADAFEADLAAVQQGEDERALDFAALRDLARRHLETYRRLAGAPFPQDPTAQLQTAIAAVFQSWSSPKATAYRDLRGLDHGMGTAVTVQRMVFGNAGGLSGAGVGFTRNPSDGVPLPWVDFLFNAQGEDVVSGRRSAQGHDRLEAVAPRVWAELVEATKILERHFGDMQDFEFTVENGELFMLQTRDGKRTPQAAARIALDMFDEGLIDRDTARARTAGLDAAALAMRVVVTEAGEVPVALGHAATASSGVATGAIALDEAQVAALEAGGRPAILVRQNAETHDVAVLDRAVGLLTRHGARTSHAAVVARQLGKVCLVGCEAMRIDEAAGRIGFGEAWLDPGAEITLDGNSGTIYPGRLHTIEQVPPELLDRLSRLAEPA
ncbi:PEP/pyruvate-binding domain-containing protein [Zavarzinia compransoris]|uniref:Pyruvate, phosphate dikinase n=1 Tax=Zavarzinia compransoris TaxID=1264899 RepID=A0A317DTW8_9PROT|nr:PEP/pyruvate-binding domain-containing protein [Zavarzinia compransoris]PWR17822.1 pyruvate, phosphate dikinase [Zavarzinia compransoris]TDP49355.1 pyruvate phosphate dikinase [Zavarzinia compransoris]